MSMDVAFATHSPATTLVTVKRVDLYVVLACHPPVLTGIVYV